jgi:hypothetical protein
MNNMYFKLNTEKFVTLFFVVLVFVLLLNAIYAHPMADDYCYANTAIHLNSWFDAVVHEYKHWGGRYAATAVMSFFAINFDLVNDFWLFCIFLIFTTLFSFYWFFSSLSYFAGAKKDWLIWAAFCFCFYIATIPALSQVMYWMAGGITYTGGYGLLLVVAGLLIRVTFAELTHTMLLIYAILTVALAFVVPGFNEVSGFLLIVVAFSGCVFTFLKKHHSRFIWLLTLIVAVAGMLTVAGAPGNEVRTGQLGKGGEIWIMPFYGIYQGAGAILAAIAVMYLLTGNNFITPLIMRLAEPIREKLLTIEKSERVAYLSVIVALFAAVYMPSYWATGVSPPSRTQTILYILPIALWVPAIGLIMSLSKIRNIRLPWLVRGKAISTVVSFLLFAVIAVSLNLKSIFYDALWRGENYDRQLQARYEIIQNAKDHGEVDLVVPELKDLPKSLYFGDILVDPTHWRNGCYSRYYRLNSIKIES